MILSLLSEISVASFNIISFFLLQRSLFSYGSSHLFTVTSKFCNRVKALMLMFSYVRQSYNTSCCLQLGLSLLQTMQNLLLNCMTSQSTTSTLNFNYQTANNQRNLEITFHFKHYRQFLYNIFQKTCFIFLGIKII